MPFIFIRITFSSYIDILPVEYHSHIESRMSEDSEDDYALFGTPLDPFDDEDCPRKKPFTVEEQFAKDEHGRRRFHGAFTGGFSAGFFNTVGSLEGWKPSSFKSSRTEKATTLHQKPEHFMDEEDMGHFGIAPSVLKAKEHFSSIKVLKRHHNFYDGSVLGVSVLKTLLQPIRETIGIKLLKQMGWKPGQGVGPRITKCEKKKRSDMKKKIHGCLPAGGNDSDSEEAIEEEYDNITFAPDDCPSYSFAHKDNFFGIGYRGLEKRPILSISQSEHEAGRKSRIPIRGQAFGVGAFEEEDEDIYSREDMSQYDFSLGTKKEDEYASRRVHGEELYDGFVLSLKKTIRKVFLPPILPKDYKAIHKSRNSRFEYLSDNHNFKKHRLSPDREGSTNVNDDIQKEAKKLTKSMPEVGNLDNFKPFISDADKQCRYEKYLKLLASGRKDKLNSLQPVTMTEWEKEKEKIEFDQTFKLFRPLTGIMEDRFTPAKQPDDIHDPLAKVEKLQSEGEDMVKAAKMNMYGPLTRITEDWKPLSLLCKRFNIPEINVNEIPIVKNKSRYSIFDKLPSMDNEVRVQFKALTESSHSESTCTLITRESSNIETVEQMQTSDAENKIDLFNAIFLDSGSEDEPDPSCSTQCNIGSSEKSAVVRNSEKYCENQDEISYEENIKNSTRNTSPARGIFEGLNYDLLQFNKETSKEDKKDDINVTVDEKIDLFNSDLVYGPKLPDKIMVKQKQVSYMPEVDVGCWIEKSKLTPSLKRNKKSKKSKHKSKHKRKKDRK